MVNFVALARSDDVHFLIESRFSVGLVVLAGKTKQLVLQNGYGFRYLCIEELHCTALGDHLGVIRYRML